MKKLPLFVIIIVALGLFATADYYLNGLDGQVILNLKDQVSDVTAAPVTPPPVLSVFKLNEKVEGYEVVSQVQTSQIFEKIDLSGINNIKIYRNTLEKELLPEELKTISLYELHGPKDQGSLTYLNIKLQFIAQIDAITETINETSEFGYNSFFFNDKNYENISFLFTQIGDNLFGFQFDKADSDAYDDVKVIIQSLISPKS